MTTGTSTPMGSSSSMASVPTLQGQPELQATPSEQTIPPQKELESQSDRPVPRPTRKGFGFWMVFLSICVSLFLSALELTAVSTALPTIVNDLQGEDFVWVASAYALASTALLPLSGGCAEIFGRRITILVALALFALGSALCGAAQDLNWLIAARTVQGAGGGGIIALGAIVVSDLVPLKERGTYQGFIAMTWAVAAAIGPLIGGTLAEKGHWRWLFYLNLPCSGLAAILVFVYLKLRTPPGTFREKIGHIDWIGNVIIVASSSSTILALTWGGVRYPWTSPRVLVPLILGLCGMGLFLMYEAFLAKYPIVPWQIVSNRTSLSGYTQNFLNPVIMLSIVYFLPTYYQACLGASPIGGGVDTLPFCSVLGVTLLFGGASVKITKKYRIQLWVGWCIYLIALGAMTTLDANSSKAHALGLPVLVGLGSGIIYSVTYFPVLAPLNVNQNAHALAFFTFLRSFGQVWGVTISTTVVQTQLGKRLTSDFTSRFPEGVAIAYSAIPLLHTLPEPIRSEVRQDFALSIRVVWQVMIGVAGLGLISSVFMKAVPLPDQVDEKWGLQQEGSRAESIFELQRQNKEVEA